jgi:hypothetical protein
MNLEPELRELFAATDEVPFPSEPTAYDRFLRRRARRSRVTAAATGLTLVTILAAAMLIPRARPAAEAPGGGSGGSGSVEVRVESQGFELAVPPGWRVARQVTGPPATAPGGTLPGTSVGARPNVVGLVLVPQSGKPDGATITIAADSNQRLDDSQVQGGSRRADGREYRLHPGTSPGEVGRYAIMWPDFCRIRTGCGGSAWPRILWVTGTATSDQDQVLRVMKRIVGALRPITNSKRPPPPPTVPAGTRVLLGKGGSGRTAWEARIEPLDGNAGFSLRFPWLQEHGKKGQGMHWESLEPEMIQQRTTYTLTDCLFWVPGSGLILSGLANQDVAAVRFELKGRQPVTAPTFGRGKGIPWVAYVSPVLPAGTGVTRVVALAAAGGKVAVDDATFGGGPLCRSR